MLANRRQLLIDDGGHQHRVDEPTWVPGDVQNTAFFWDVLLVDDGDFPEPNVGEKPIESSNESIRKGRRREARLLILTLLHACEVGCPHLEKTPAVCAQASDLGSASASGAAERAVNRFQRCVARMYFRGWSIHD